MILSSEQILRLALSYGQAGAQGSAEAMRRSLIGLGQPGSSGQAPYGARNQEQLIRAVAQQPTPAAAPRPHAHPGQIARAGSPQALTGADILWLQRIPQDPAKVSFEDAVTVAHLAMASELTARPGTNEPVAVPEGDKRLLRAIYAPIRELHDQLAARAALERAKVSLPPVPSAALPALAEAIASEIPQLTEDEALSRAGALLQEKLQARALVRQQKIQAAEVDLERAEAAAAQRLSTSAPAYSE